jgi:hypothetical protein
MSSEQAAKFALAINLKTATALGRHLNELRMLRALAQCLTLAQCQPLE